METHGTEIDMLERFVADNDELLALEELLGRFNIFDALRIARAEIRHSNFLRWLLTPGESHGQGDLFLKAVLMDFLRKARARGKSPPISAVELESRDLGSAQVTRESDHIDLLIVLDQPPLVVAVENKVDSGEHSKQLERYGDTIVQRFPRHARLLVFLTSDGDEPSDDRWTPYSYADLHTTLARARRANAAAIGADIAVFLDQYLSLIGSRFMDNPELDRLCKLIYTNHRQALDLIWERVGSPASGLVGAIKDWLEARSNDWLVIAAKDKEVEFIPRAWDAMLPAIGHRKTFDKRHWMTARLRVESDHLRLYVIVCPSTNQVFRKRLIERFTDNKNEFGFSLFFKKKEASEAWTRIRSEQVCDLPEDDDPNASAILEHVEKCLTTFLAQTARLPAVVTDLVAKAPPQLDQPSNLTTAARAG